jgi:hypothetical protein
MTWQVLLVINLSLAAVWNGFEWLVQEGPERTRAGRRFLLTVCLYPVLRALIPLLIPGACR